MSDFSSFSAQAFRCFIALALVGGTEQGHAQNPSPQMLLVCGKGAESDQSYLTATLSHPFHARFDLPCEVATCLPDEAHLAEFRFLVIARGVETEPGAAGRLLAWTKQGGHLLVLGKGLPDVAGNKFSTGWKNLLGGEGVLPVTDAGVLLPEQEILKRLGGKVYDWMQNGLGLGPLEGAKNIIGTEQATLFSVHDVGRGKVYFLGQDIGSLPGTEGLLQLTKILQELAEQSGAKTVPTTREAWDYLPLGEPVPRQTGNQTLAPFRNLPQLRHTVPATGQPVALVQGGQAGAILITPNKPNRNLQKAIEEFVAVIKASSGATLPIYRESQVSLDLKKNPPGIHTQDGRSWTSAIVIGNIDQLPVTVRSEVAKLPPEGFLQKSAERIFYVVGHDQTPEGLDVDGTAYGLTDLMESQLGVRWLWPGEVGTVIPRRRYISLLPTHVTDSPALVQRKLRNWGANSERMADDSKLTLGLRELGRPDLDVYASKHAVTDDWFDRLRVGSSWKADFTHAYNTWYERFGRQHPDWFALQPDGTRRQDPKRPRLNKENWGVIAQAAADALDDFAKDPRQKIASISPNDGGANAWDLSEPARHCDPANGDKIYLTAQIGGKTFHIPYVSLSDRVLDFYNHVAEMATQARPGTLLGCYAYGGYRLPPLKTKPNPQLVFGFVGLGYFDDAMRYADLQAWDGWARFGNAMFLRPNALYMGHGMPAIFVHKLADDLRHCYQTGMMGADFDSVSHHWATQGINYYVLAKLLWNPGLNVDDVVEDYCQAGFGPAAKEIHRYFNTLEQLTSHLAEKVSSNLANDLRDEEADIGTPMQVRDKAFFALLPAFYSPEKLAELQAMLDTAKKLAVNQEEVLARIAFLQRGLDYARAQSLVFRLLLDHTPGVKDVALAEALRNRKALFQEMYDHDFLAVGLPRLLWTEKRLNLRN